MIPEYIASLFELWFNKSFDNEFIVRLFQMNELLLPAHGCSHSPFHYINYHYHVLVLYFVNTTVLSAQSKTLLPWSIISIEDEVELIADFFHEVVKPRLAGEEQFIMDSYISICWTREESEESATLC